MSAFSSTARSGALGKIVATPDGGSETLLARITQWTFNPTSSVTAWGDSDGGGFTNRKPARKDGTGTGTGRFDTGTKIYDVLKAGDTPKLILWEDASDYWALPCVVVTSFNITYDVDSKEVVEFSFDFETDGPYYAPGETGAPTETLTLPAGHADE